MYIRLLARDEIINMIKVPTRWIIPNSFSHVFRSTPTIGCGGGFADLPLTIVSHVSVRFNDILFASVHFSTFPTSADAE